MTRHQHIHYVNSRNRFSHDTHSHLTVRLPSDILGRNITSVRLDSVQVEQGYYSMNSTTNTFSVVDGSGTQAIVVPVGNYSSVTLPAALKTVLDAGTDRTWTISFDTLTGKLSFAADGSFTIVPSDYSGRWLGMTSSLVSLDGSAATSPNVCVLSGPMFLDVICSHHVSSSESGNPWKTNLLARIPAESSSTANTIFWSSKNITMQTINSRSLGDLILSLYSDQGAPVNLNGTHWAATLIVEYE